MNIDGLKGGRFLRDNIILIKVYNQTVEERTKSFVWSMVAILLAISIIGLVLTYTSPVKKTLGDVSIEIDYDGYWGGAVSFGDDIRSVHGNGTTWINGTVTGNVKLVSAAISKTDNQTGQLGVRIWDHGKIVEEGYTSEIKGHVWISYSD